MCNIQLKEKFMKEVYISQQTRNAMLSTYTNNILPLEKSLNKNLEEFSTEDIVILLENSNGISRGYKSSIFSFCNSFLAWCSDNGYINYNPCSTILAKDYMNTTMEQEMKGLLGIKTFYNVMRTLETKSNGLSIMPLILARYGVYGEKGRDIRYLEPNDIDHDNSCINIYNKVNNHEDYGLLLTKLTVDKQFFNWYNKYKQEIKQGFKEGMGTRKSEVNFVESPYLIKKTNYVASEGDVVSINTLLNYIYRNCQSSGLNRISLSKMVHSRKLDILLSIREKRELNFNDMVRVNKIFNYTTKTTQGATNLKKFWERIANEKVLEGNEIKLDFNGKLFVEDLKIRINFI